MITSLTFVCIWLVIHSINIAYLVAYQHWVMVIFALNWMIDLIDVQNTREFGNRWWNFFVWQHGQRANTLSESFIRRVRRIYSSRLLTNGNQEWKSALSTGRICICFMIFRFIIYEDILRSGTFLRIIIPICILPCDQPKCFWNQQNIVSRN